jgi:glycosyltransferase involved in cell wall biosynthesis
MTRGNGVLLIMPTDQTKHAGPVSVWITAAGWAAAARKRYGAAWLLTPSGVLTPEEARALASDPTRHRTREKPAWRRHVPLIASTLVKDVRSLVNARRFHGSALRGPWEHQSPAFVWQHHELFQRGGMTAARRLGCPLVVFVDAPVVWEGKQWGVQRPGWSRLLEAVGERPQLREADVVACVTEEVAEETLRLGADAERVLVTPCSVDTDSFHPGVSGRDVRRRLGLDGNFVVGWIGTFHRFHGLDLLVEAAARAQRNVTDLCLLLVGDGLDRPRIQALCQQLGIRKVVLTGTVPHDEVPEHIAAMDVAVIVDPGRETFHYSPLKLREYLACGRPVVAPRSGELLRNLRDGVEAVLIPPGHSGALSNALEGLSRNPELRSLIAAFGHQRVLSEWTWETQLEAVEQLVDRLPQRAPLGSGVDRTPTGP